MAALKGILWAAAMFISLKIIFELVGCNSMVRMFPEGRRWWLLPAQLASLGAFALLILYNPF